MPLLDFFKHLRPQTCSCCAADGCCDKDSCCAPADGANEPCCCEDDACCEDETCSDGDCCCEGCKPKENTERFIKVLGGGCKNCHKLMENTEEALTSLGLDDTVELVSDMAVIAGYGVLSTPALVVDGKVVSTGRVLTPAQAAKAIQEVRGM